MLDQAQRRQVIQLAQPENVRVRQDTGNSPYLGQTDPPALLDLQQSSLSQKSSVGSRANRNQIRSFSRSALAEREAIRVIQGAIGEVYSDIEYKNKKDALLAEYLIKCH